MRSSRVRRARVGALVIGAALGLSGCTDWAMSDVDWAFDYVPWFSTMRDDVTLDPYEMPRLPAAHTIPSTNPNGEAEPLFTQAQLDSVGAVLRNPVPPTPAVLARGELQYERQCMVCHGPTGAGDGPVVGPGKFPFAPPLNNAATAARSDAYIYAVVRVGRGLMPAYGPRMSELERWAVVHYVRTLQEGGVVDVPVNPAAATAPQNVPPVLVPAPAAEQARNAGAGQPPAPATEDDIVQ